jgi:hypothetical protein
MDGQVGRVDTWWVVSVAITSTQSAGGCLAAGGRLTLGDRTDGDSWTMVQGRSLRLGVFTPPERALVDAQIQPVVVMR